MNYYNEFDPHAAAWLRELINQKLIPNGHVDERSITEVQPGDLAGFIQCHFFAGIGGWSYALQLAGWPEDRPVWTGSCPCPSFSVANLHNTGAKGQGDSRHLLPSWGSLICEYLPPVIFGEQVESAIGWGWLDELGDGLEKENYAVGAAVLPACCFGAEHERKRLYWGAYASGEGREGHKQVECLPVPKASAFPVAGDNFADARRALAGDLGNLLHCDGLSVQMERNALRGYGNAIVPQVAAEFVKAFMSI